MRQEAISEIRYTRATLRILRDHVPHSVVQMYFHGAHVGVYLGPNNLCT